MSSVHITVKELLPVVVASAVWGRHWEGKTVKVKCYNAAVVAVLRSGWSKNNLAMHLMRCLFFFMARFHFFLVSEHIPGKDNIAADSQSRNNLSLFYEQVPGVNQLPTIFPDELLQALILQQPDCMDVSQLENLVQFYFSKGLAQSTQRTYKAGQNRFLKFCQENGITAPLPLSENLVCYFVSVLADQGLKHRTVKVICQH